MFQHLPHERRLDSVSKDMAKSMLAMKANKKLVHNHLMRDTGKVVLLKDLHNIAAEKHRHRNSLTDLISQMKKSPGNHHGYGFSK